MCCYKEYKNFERFNNIVQAMLNVAISFIHTLPQHCQQQQDDANDRKKDDSTSPSEPQKVKTDDDMCKIDDANADSAASCDVDLKEKTTEKEKETEKEDSGCDEEVWTLEEKDRLFQFVTKVFLMNFPMYMAYKHSVNTSLEELSQQEAAALNNYCELSVSPHSVFLQYPSQYSVITLTGNQHGLSPCAFCVIAVSNYNLCIVALDYLDIVIDFTNYITFVIILFCLHEIVMISYYNLLYH